MRALRGLGIGEASKNMLTLVMSLRQLLNIKAKIFLVDRYPKYTSILPQRIES